MHVTVVGGGMIVHDQILPSLYQLRRRGLVGNITVCARRKETLDSLAANPRIAAAFPGQSFTATTAPYADVLANAAQRNLTIICLPDQLHFDAVMHAIAAEQHVICVKPLVQKIQQAVLIEKAAHERGLFVGIEYHKRFDDRALMARDRYRQGLFGDFKLGTARLFEKWYYRHSNFQNWFSMENSDAFTYIGCHYVDLVHFITGLMPVSISVAGVPEAFPNGTEAWMWTDARVRWSNGALLNVQNALGYPDQGPGSNTQGMTLWCSRGDSGGFLNHTDSHRGLEYCYVDGGYSEPSPDYMQYVPNALDEGEHVVGYGYRSVEALVEAAQAVEQDRSSLAAIEARGIVATPSNSSYNELVTEAARLSLENDGREVLIQYGVLPFVHLKSYL
ncbi:Gfo/Idh/MocA family protein [Bryobacter aggregatus]|uniref:Gfo/Idh/MocA family protein n=1 Tax=Bryobacter aggregatus TaxID=360054 RepID=UPI0004E1B5D1|nr:Gfo/Idh/MocA family oxidoreductase [Bryobacter aggregatus]